MQFDCTYINRRHDTRSTIQIGLCVSYCVYYESCLELHLYILSLPRLCLEEFIRLELEHPRDHVGREHLNLSVEVAHIAIVEASRGLDFVFRVRNLVL